jgi:hypothetical protein
MLPTVSSQKRTPCTKFGRESDGPFIMFIPEEKEEKRKSAGSGV